MEQRENTECMASKNEGNIPGERTERSVFHARGYNRARPVYTSICACFTSRGVRCAGTVIDHAILPRTSSGLYRKFQTTFPPNFSYADSLSARSSLCKSPSRKFTIDADHLPAIYPRSNYAMRNDSLSEIIKGRSRELE